MMSKPVSGLNLGQTAFIALGLCAVWLILSLVYMWFGPSLPEGEVALGGFARFIALVVPLGLAAFLVQSQLQVQKLRLQSEQLSQEILSLRQSSKAARPAPLQLATPPKLAPKPAPPPPEEPALALGTPVEAPRPLAIEDFIRAVNFPNSPDDHQGINSLRVALEDREAARLIRASQDVLSLLAQDGIYVDDLRPDRPRPEIWRRFAKGERGKVVAALGGVHDRSSLALTTARMRNDPVFRDVAHHFLRQFDRSFHIFETSASDVDLVELAETRTARAFMLLGRVAGVFD